MPRIYKTAQGRTVDLAAIMTQNERTRAVGNMQVNARGDAIDSHNQIVAPRNRQVNKSLASGIDQHIVTKAAPKAPAKTQQKKSEPIVESQVTAAEATTVAPAQGLAAALARANQNKDNE